MKKTNSKKFLSVILCAVLMFATSAFALQAFAADALNSVSVAFPYDYDPVTSPFIEEGYFYAVTNPEANELEGKVRYTWEVKDKASGEIQDDYYEKYGNSLWIDLDPGEYTVQVTAFYNGSSVTSEIATFTVVEETDYYELGDALYAMPTYLAFRYTAESWKTLSDAIGVAETILFDDLHYTQEQVDKALADLLNAQKNLVKADLGILGQLMDAIDMMIQYIMHLMDMFDLPIYMF